MQFAARVRVISMYDRRLTSVTAKQAQHMLADGEVVVSGSGNSVVRAVKRVNERHAPIGACSVTTVGSYMGTRYTHREEIKNRAGDVIGYQIELNRIHADDAPLFRLAVTDNLVQVGA